MAKASGFHKKASKRVTIRKKQMVIKKVREHRKKVKKMAKKEGGNKHHKKEKMLVMPRSAPFDLQWDGSVVPTKKKEVKRKVAVTESTIDCTATPPLPMSTDVVPVDADA